MPTLSEALGNLEKEKQDQVTLNSSKMVYSVPSGTKDVNVKFTIGGRAFKQKKVYRNPKPIFGMSEASFESPEAATSGKIEHEKPIDAAQGIVNIAMQTKIKNTDTKPERAFNKTVYGLHRMGGAGTDFAEAHIQKIEELKLLKEDSFIEMRFKNHEQAQGKWKGGL